jgi:hypothetical protein
VVVSRANTNFVVRSVPKLQVEAGLSVGRRLREVRQVHRGVAGMLLGRGIEEGIAKGGNSEAGRRERGGKV